ncbi:hypothetical protein [Achromobacter spanius]|uniref:hypothetical protein n=1 Tax=Achromobacter spanius TaxID=217203 RepID=UPI00320B382B
MKKILFSLTNWAALAGIIGVSASNLFDDAYKGYFAFGLFLAALAFTCWQIYRVADAALSRRYKKGYLPISSVARWTTLDGKNYTYDVVRHIQIKQPYMRSFPHRFSWTGSQLPKITSDLQKVGDKIEPVSAPDGGNWHEVKLTFPQTRIYNDVEVIQFTMSIDDADEKSAPFLSQVVESPIRVLSYHVELLHTTQSYCKEVAKVTRKPLDKPSAQDEWVADVSFDATTKSYSYQLLNPEPNFSYKLQWQRPAPNGARPGARTKGRGRAAHKA